MSADVVRLRVWCPCCAGEGQVVVEVAQWGDGTGRVDSMGWREDCGACDGSGHVDCAEAWVLRGRAP